MGSPARVSAMLARDLDMGDQSHSEGGKGCATSSPEQGGSLQYGPPWQAWTSAMTTLCMEESGYHKTYEARDAAEELAWQMGDQAVAADAAM
jgi:hypothetical protein